MHILVGKGDQCGIVDVPEGRSSTSHMYECEEWRTNLGFGMMFMFDLVHLVAEKYTVKNKAERSEKQIIGLINNVPYLERVVIDNRTVGYKSTDGRVSLMLPNLGV